MKKSQAKKSTKPEIDWERYAKKKDSKTTYGFRCDIAIVDRVNAMAESKNTSRSALVEIALREFLEKYE